MSVETRSVKPSDDDETIESIPCISEISIFADDTHGNHLDAHFDDEESKDEMISDGSPETSDSVTFLLTWLKHGKSDAVDENDEDGDASEPRPCDEL